MPYTLHPTPYTLLQGLLGFNASKARLPPVKGWQVLNPQPSTLNPQPSTLNP